MFEISKCGILQLSCKFVESRRQHIFDIGILITGLWLFFWWEITLLWRSLKIAIVHAEYAWNTLTSAWKWPFVGCRNAIEHICSQMSALSRTRTSIFNSWLGAVPNHWHLAAKVGVGEGQEGGECGERKWRHGGRECGWMRDRTNEWTGGNGTRLDTGEVREWTWVVQQSIAWSQVQKGQRVSCGLRPA